MRLLLLLYDRLRYMFHLILLLELHHWLHHYLYQPMCLLLCSSCRLYLLHFLRLLNL